MWHRLPGRRRCSSRELPDKLSRPIFIGINRQPDASRPYCQNPFSGGFCMSFHLTRASFRTIAPRLPLALAVAALIISVSSTVFSQRDNKSQTQSSASNVQRMDIMRSKLETMRRSLESAIASIPAKDTSDKTKDSSDKTKNAD